MVASPEDVLTTMMTSSALKGWGSTARIVWLMPFTLFPAIGSKSTVQSEAYVGWLASDLRVSEYDVRSGTSHARHRSAPTGTLQTVLRTFSLTVLPQSAPSANSTNSCDSGCKTAAL